MVCRNPTTAEEARKEIAAEAKGDAAVHVHILDMSEPKSIHAFAKGFLEKFDKLNCLVNNAGCMVNNREVQRLHSSINNQISEQDISSNRSLKMV